MSVIVLTRVTIDPADAGELVVTHAAAVASQEAAGLEAAELGKIDETTWIAVWHWESLDHLTTARANPPAEAHAAFALTTNPTVEEIDVVDAL